MREQEEKRKMGKVGFVFLCIAVFIVFFIGSVVFKTTHQPAWAKKFAVEWNDEIGTKELDLPYGESEANKFDLYLPKDKSHQNYGLVIYLHAGGFTAGDKTDDSQMLEWLCSKGYVTAGINYTLRNETNEKSVLSQAAEIKEAIPKVIEEAQKLGYHINEMAIGGGSAGHALAMIYAYRDAKESPVPVKLLFGAVGPSSFYAEDWDIYGFDQDTEEARKGAAGLLGVMGGVELTPEEIKDGSCLEKLKPISAVMWVDKDTVPSVVAYGKYDKVQPFKGSQRLLKAYQDAGIDYRYFEMPHSGHGLQNDSKLYQEWLETVEEYLNKYMPVEK